MRMRELEVDDWTENLKHYTLGYNVTILKCFWFNELELVEHGYKEFPCTHSHIDITRHFILKLQE